jgi:chromate transporter
MNILIQLILSFSTIGLFAFGGGYAVLSFLQHEVTRRGWMTTERFADLIAISQSTPGPIAINLATFVGYDTGGVAGALVATLAVALPGMIGITVLGIFFFHFYERPGVQAVFEGLRPAVLGLIAAAAWHIGCVAINSGAAVAIAVVAAILIAKWNVHPVFLVAGSAMAGIFLM